MQYIKTMTDSLAPIRQKDSNSDLVTNTLKDLVSEFCQFVIAMETLS